MVSGSGGKADVGGFGLNYVCAGESSGNPTVVLEAGSGFPLKTWDKVWNEISGITQVFAYDRAGLGLSDRGDKPRHSQQMVENLHALLEKANIASPYILVGHSFGGLNVRLFANNFPDQVVGLVLVDPSHEEQEVKWMPLLSPESRKMYQKLTAIEGTREDFLASLEQVSASRKSYGEMPLTVLSAGRKDHNTEESHAMWIALHQDLLTLSANASHVIVENSGHNIHREQPGAVADAIRNVLKMV